MHARIFFYESTISKCQFCNIALYCFTFFFKFSVWVFIIGATKCFGNNNAHFGDNCVHNTGSWLKADESFFGKT